MRPQYFDENDRQLLLDTYFADLDGASRQTLVRRIERFEATLNRRHTARRYYKTSQNQSARQECARRLPTPSGLRPRCTPADGRFTLRDERRS